VSGCIQVDIWSDKSARADSDKTNIEDRAAIVYENIMTESYVGAIVTSERPFDPGKGTQLGCICTFIVKFRRDLGGRDYSETSGGKY